MGTMEPHASYERYVKLQKHRFMNTMAYSEISSTFCSRMIKIILTTIFDSIILSFYSRPTSSEAEKIRSIYYEAEYDGRLQDCQRYLNDCNISFLDLVSDMISIEARKIM